MILFLDIETVPDLTLWTPDKPDTFPPLYAHKIVCIGGLALTDYPKLEAIHFGCLGEREPAQTEEVILATMTRALTKPALLLCTFNGRSFDLPVISLRAMRYGIAMPNLFTKEVRYRYSADGHMDLMDHISDFGAARFMSLDGLARLIGLPGKQGMEGSEVARLVAAGEMDKVRSYCLSDVAQTAFLWLRYGHHTGRLRPETYQKATRDLIAYLEASGRVPEMVAGIDPERLLCTSEGRAS